MGKWWERQESAHLTQTPAYHMPMLSNKLVCLDSGLNSRLSVREKARVTSASGGHRAHACSCLARGLVKVLRMVSVSVRIGA
jgi:hypothetical protein